MVNSVQNGVGPAYAGGIFGYNAFELPISTTAYTFNLTSESASLEVTAEQTAETANAGTLYDVCAGLYTSVLPDAYSINNLTFNASNATATARRLAGSTAVGDIAAGAIAGKANGNGGGNNSAVIQNLTVNLNTCSINAFGYSFDSEYAGQGNNVYAGGVIGYVRNYGVYGGNVGLSNISVTFDRSLDNSDYAVYGIQNAEVASNASDYWSEGYVGGMFGMMESGYATNLTVDGTLKDRTVIYFNGTNDPNTSSVGGLIGATRNLRNDNGDASGDSYAVTYSTVTDVHVAGRAYVGTQSTDWRWDIFVGGAIGVFGTANKNSAGTGLKGSNFASGITVEDCAIEAIGDEAMLTYAGGVFGGAWWVSSANISNCISRNNSVLASSATFNTFAAGIVGQLQAGTVENCLAINNTVEAITYSDSTEFNNIQVRAYASGICARVYQSSSTIRNNISNAVVSASAPYITSSGYAVMSGIGITDGGNVESTNYFVAANIEVDNIDNAYAVRTRDGSYPTSNNSYAIALSGSSTSHTSNGATSHNMNGDSGWNVYSGLGISPNEDDIAGRQYKVNIVGNGDFTLNGLTFTPNAQGTYYAQILVDGELLCSYPIIVGSFAPSDVEVYDGANGTTQISENNSHNYSTGDNGSIRYTVTYEYADQESISRRGQQTSWTIPDVPENVVHYSIAVNASVGAGFATANLSLYNSSGDLIYNLGSLTGGLFAGRSDTFEINNLEGSPDGFYLYNSSDDSLALNSITIVYTIQVNTYYEYFQLYAGEEAEAGDTYYANSVSISALDGSGNAMIASPQVYLATNGLYGYNGADGGGAESILSNAAALTDIQVASRYFTVEYSEDGKAINITPVLGNTTGAALVLMYQLSDGSYYSVIIEVVPNAIVGLSIAPAADTPPRAIADNGNYIYASGETVRLEAEVEYRFSYNRFIVDVEFTKDDSSSTSASTVQPNGTVLVSGSSLQTVVVSCSPISDGSAIGNMSATLTIEISNSITVVADDMSGTSYAPVSDNDAVAGYPFSFTLDPNPGYGLNPSLLQFDFDGGNIDGHSWHVEMPEERTDNNAGKAYFVGGNTNADQIEYVIYNNNNHTISYEEVSRTASVPEGALALTYSYNASTGVYTITLPAALFKISGLSQVTINASFQKVYSIMFDLGEWADDGSDNGGINSRYFIYQVKNGTAINSDLYNSITGELGSLFGETQNRAGFTFKGFYTTTSANTLASYGDSFTEMFKNGDGTSVIRGSMNFYARWNYTVALHAPSGIGIESGLSSSLLEENLKDGTDNSIIPIDIQHGFSFEITGTYAGTPRVEVYTVGADGALVPLAVTNVNGVYTIDNPEEITGTIHIYIYADNLTLAVSDTMDATQTSIDLRKDGIFTARYTVNYGSGVNAANGHAEDIVFTFDSELPVGTRLRLFYHANGSAVAVGYYEVGSGDITSVAATAFRPLTGSDSSGSGDSATIFAFEGTLTSESLYLVVTLPNNDTDNFSDISSLNITVNAYSTTLTTTPYETAGVTYGDSESGGETGTDTKVQGVTDPENISIEATVNLFNIVHRYGNPSGNTLTFKAENTSTAEGAPKDVRHADKYYVWRIAATYWDENMVANGVSYVTTDGYIYIAASTALALNNFSGDVIVLMEVTNTQYPAAGAVVWTYTSGN